MNKTFTIAEMKNMVGVVIPMVQVKLEKVWPVTVREGQYGAFNIQNGEVSDETGSMKLALKYREPIQFKVGDVIYIKSEIKKNKLEGVMVKLEQYTSKSGEAVSKLCLEVTKSATIVPIHALTNNQNAPQSNALPHRNEDNPETNTNVAKPQSEALKEVLNNTVSPQRKTLSLNDRINRYGPLYKICHDKACSYFEGKTVSAEQVMVVTNLFFEKAIDQGMLEEIELADMAEADIAF